MKTLKSVMMALIVIIAVTSIPFSTNLNAGSLVKANQPNSAVYVTFDQAILISFLWQCMSSLMRICWEPTSSVILSQFCILAQRFILQAHMDNGICSSSPIVYFRD